jgi:predicted TIM-barrel fold metal-dependent hydrolase
MLPSITLEEHYLSSAYIEAQKSDSSLLDLNADFPPQLINKLKSLTDDRIKDMDNGNVSIQVLSHAPVDPSPSLSKQINDELAQAISKNPSRLRGFATLPMGEPPAAAQELERCVKELGFVGALVDNHIDGKFYDGEKFWCVFEKAQDLDVPIYIHPTFTAESDMAKYRGNYNDRIAMALSNFGWGWHSDTGLHFLRLFAAGVFDRFPKLKLVLGHMGELLPFQLDRIYGIAEHFGRERKLKDVWDENVWVTTSGMFSLAPLACLLQTKSRDKVLYSVDYPFSNNERGAEFMSKVEKSELFGEELDGFAYKNAEKLLKIKVSK